MASSRIVCAVPRRSVAVYFAEPGWIHCVLLSSGIRHLLVAGPLYGLYWSLFCHRNEALIAISASGGFS